MNINYLHLFTFYGFLWRTLYNRRCRFRLVKLLKTSKVGNWIQVRNKNFRLYDIYMSNAMHESTCDKLYHTFNTSYNPDDALKRLLHDFLS